MLTRKQAEFINAATPKRDEGRAHLCHAWVAKVDGVRWVVATDGHRLHAVRAPEKLQVKEESWVVVDHFGGVFPVGGKKQTPPPLQSPAWAADRKMEKVDRDHLEAAAHVGGTTLYTTLYTTLDRALVVGVHCRWTEADPDNVHIDARYVRDAIMMARPTGPPRVVADLDGFSIFEDPADEGEDYVEVGWSSVTEAVAFQQDAAEPEWRAVVMPVRA